MFRLGNLNQVVKATKRAYGSVSVAPSSNVTFSCMPVGELSDAMYTEPDPLGGTRYCLPEGTLLSVQVADVSAGPDEWCTRGPLVLHERVGGGSTSHASMRALIHPTGSRVSGGLCCCDDEDWFCLCGWPSIPQYHSFGGGPGGVMFTSLQVLDMYSDDLYFQGGSVTLCSDLPGMDPTLPQKVYFEMKAYTGYQHLYTVVHNEDGEYVATVYPAQGLRETTWIETSCAEGRLRGLAKTVQQPTLEVNVRLEDGQPGMSNADAGYYYSINNAFERYYSVEFPPHIQTELIGIKAMEFPGFVFVRWEGNGVALDSEGNVREDVTLCPFVGAGQPYTERLIYVKCQNTWLAPTSRELTAVFRPCTHCGWRTVSEAPAAERVDNVVGSLLGDTCLPDGLGFYKKAGTDDFYGCRWYIHNKIQTVGVFWAITGMPARIGIVGISTQGGGNNGTSSSHQNGCDVDIRYVRNDDQEAALDLAVVNNRRFFDRAKTEHLINLMKLGGAQLIFIAPETAIPEDAIVTYWPNHTHHMHVRFPDPDGSQAATCPPCPAEYK